MGTLLLDKYEIVRVIGKGGMGTVYEAKEVASGRRVAVKWMNEQAFVDGDPHVVRFQREARIAGSLDSPHVTAVYECARDTTKDVLFQVMELLEGEDLGALLERVGALESNAALRIAIQACSGLAAAHRAGIVHRDIKPENLFLSRRDENEIVVKVVDFGIAKLRRPKGGSSETAGSMSSMTNSGEMLGTPLFMAPEQFEGAKHADARADVYSMGATLFTMLAGASPYAQMRSFFQIYRAITSGAVPSLRQKAPWVRPEITQIVEKAMQIDSLARYADATELLAALTNVFEGSPVLTRDMLVESPPEQKKIPVVDPFAKTIAQQPIGEGAKQDDAPVPWWRKLLK